MNQRELGQELFDEISQHLLMDDTPSNYLNELSKSSRFLESQFSYLEKLKTTEQNKTHHPEGNVWNHTMMVVDEAAKVRQKSKEPLCFMWAALLHDVGKPQTTQKKKGRWVSYNHDVMGADLVHEILNGIETPQHFVENVTVLVRWHMQILLIAKNISRTQIDQMKEEVDLEELMLLGMCDRCGRMGVNRREVQADLDRFRSLVCNSK